LQRLGSPGSCGRTSEYQYGPTVTPMENLTQNKAANRRSSRRQQGRRTIRVQCRRGALGLGTNVATGYIDVSEGGMQLVTAEPLREGDEVEIVFEGYGIQKSIRRIGEVRWMQSTADGRCHAGLRFQKLISHRDVQSLSRP
jgi:hypothetical protein